MRQETGDRRQETGDRRQETYLNKKKQVHIEKDYREHTIFKQNNGRKSCDTVPLNK